jgi:hypothetical protein
VPSTPGHRDGCAPSSRPLQPDSDLMPACELVGRCPRRLPTCPRCRSRSRHTIVSVAGVLQAVRLWDAACSPAADTSAPITQDVPAGQPAEAVTGERGRMPPELRRGSPQFGGRSSAGQPRGTIDLEQTLDRLPTRITQDGKLSTSPTTHDPSGNALATRVKHPVGSPPPTSM